MLVASSHARCSRVRGVQQVQESEQNNNCCGNFDLLEIYKTAHWCLYHRRWSVFTHTYRNKGV